MLASGELAAVVGVEIDSPDAAPLIPDPAEAGFAALQQRGLYPINHLVVIRDDLLAERPELGAQVFDAFARSKQLYVERLRAGEVHDKTDRMYARVMELTGADPLPYGIEPNRAVLEELLRNAVDQKILDRAPRLEDVFAAGHARPRRLTMRIAIAADHNGVALKGRLVEVLRAQGHEVTDCGTRRHRGRRRLPAAVRGRVPPGGGGVRRPRDRRRRQRPRARSSPATRSAGSAPACAPTSGTRRSPAATTTRTCWCWARRRSTRTWPSRWWPPG